MALQGISFVSGPADLAVGASFLSDPSVGLLRQYWEWLFGAAILLAVAVTLLLRRSARYSALVVKELEDYLTPAQPPTPPPGPSTPDSAALAEQKTAIWNAIRSHPAPSNEIQIQWLVNMLAEARLNVRFRNLFFLIFGSQQRFLRELNQSGTKTRAQADAFFRQLGEQNEKVRAMPFNDWAGFLAGEGLITVGVDAFTLTPIGQDFLVWITRERLPDRTFEG